MRRQANLVGYCALYEFEDLIVDLMQANLGELHDLKRLELSRRLYKATRILGRSASLAERVRPKRPSRRLAQRYELFFPIFNHPHELYGLHALRNWREMSRVAACYLCEAWKTRLPVYLLEQLKRFDHVFVGVLTSVDAVAKICGRPCSYLPMGVDAARFCPAPSNAPRTRTIDVCGIGRRSPVTHQALLDLAAQDGLFYYYDTVQTAAAGGTTAISFRVTNASEHRRLLANVLKRSRYFIANRAWADQPQLTRGKEEIAARFYEGAAAGAVMLGEPPDSDDFRSQFGYPDAVVRTPFHAAHIADVIHELDRDPARVARIRHDSVAHALRHHDWSQRLRVVLETLGLPITQRLLAREARLEALARRAPNAS